MSATAVPAGPGASAGMPDRTGVPAGGGAAGGWSFAPTRLVALLHHHGVLDDADVQVAGALARLTGEGRDEVLDAVALAVRAPRQGHVCLDLRRLHEVGIAPEGEARLEVDLPPLEGWLEALRTSPAVREPGEGRVSPLVLDRHRLYLDRYWRYEQRLLDGLQRLLLREPAGHDSSAVADALERLFAGDGDDGQRRAASLAARNALTVLTGGPGTGKTTSVARILAVLLATAPAGRDLRIVLAAPTGRAAARLAEALRSSVTALGLDGSVAARLATLPSLTLHRLLGYRPSAPTRFRHDAAWPLPHDVVVVDEASMASLPLMAKLVDALGPDSRLVLVGDKDQLTSVDAGAVLADLCAAATPPAAPSVPLVSARSDADPRPTDAGPRAPDAGSADHAAAVPEPWAPRLPGLDPLPASSDPDPPPAPAPASSTSASPPARGVPDATVPAIADRVVVLTTFHRFGTDSGIGELARAIQRAGAADDATGGDETAWDEVLGLLRGRDAGSVTDGDIALVPPAAGSGPALAGATLQEVLAAYAEAIGLALGGGDPLEVLAAFEGVRVLTALRRGPDGVDALNRTIEQELVARVPGYRADEPHPVGRPVIVTRNDHRAELFNGDVGVVVRHPDDPARRRVAFPAPGGGVRLVAPARMPDAEPVFALSVHRAQGSQYGRVVLVLPRVDSPLLTRELVYTGVTRAREHVTVLADERLLVAALRRRAQRASGLAERLRAVTP